MPTIAPIVGYCDGLGYLYCTPCARELGVFGEPVHADSAPCNAECCERCQRVLTSGTEAARLPHAPCRETGEHQPRSWGDPAHWCDGSGEAGA